MDAQRLARVIANLDNDDFQKREHASNELADLGGLAEGHCGRRWKEIFRLR
jgi:hypothetical protein